MKKNVQFLINHDDDTLIFYCHDCSFIELQSKKSNVLLYPIFGNTYEKQDYAVINYFVNSYCRGRKQKIIVLGHCRCKFLINKLTNHIKPPMLSRDKLESFFGKEINLFELVKKNIEDLLWKAHEYLHFLNFSRITKARIDVIGILVDEDKNTIKQIKLNICTKQLSLN